MQGSPSSHWAPLSPGISSHAPVAGLHWAIAQRGAGPQLLVLPLHVPPLHWSLSVQGFLSSQSWKSLAGLATHLPPSQAAVLQVFARA